MKFKYIFIFILFFSLIGCTKNSKNDEESFSSQNGKSDKSENEMKKLPMNYNKLENYLGDSFIPVYSVKTNLDNDIDDEICIAYKQNNLSTVKVVIFDLFPKNTIKIKAEFKTNIFDKESFLFQFQNFFEQKDLTLLIEGKSEDKKSLLYIYRYEEGEYVLIKEFAADYSVIVNYTEVDSESGKYSKMKDIITVDNYIGVTNSNVQQKSVYKWFEDQKVFTVVETSKIVFSSNIVHSSVYASEESFLDYIKGVWYLDKYEYILKSNEQIDKLNNNNIEFVQISSKPYEIGIKNEDYLNKYPASKIFRVWNGNIPGVRIVSFGLNKNKNSRQKDIEVYLIEANRLKVIGPNKFDEKDYIRLSKPLFEYINELKEAKIKKETTQITNFLVKDFRSPEGVLISFTGNNEFNIQKDNINEKGAYKITYDKSGYLITFLFDNKNNIFKYSNYYIV